MPTSTSCPFRVKALIMIMKDNRNKENISWSTESATPSLTNMSNDMANFSLLDPWQNNNIPLHSIADLACN
jgi:hypothetical protein